MWTCGGYCRICADKEPRGGRKSVTLMHFPLNKVSSTSETNRRVAESDAGTKADAKGHIEKGLGTVESARIAHRGVHGEDRPLAAAPYAVVRAQRSPSEIKRIRALDNGTATVGDGQVSERPMTVASTDKVGRFTTSEVPAALYLKDLTLNKSFSTFSRSNQIYLAAITWDLSGKPPRVYPPPELAGTTQATYAMKPNETVEFIGDGLQLWPQAPVEGGLFVQLVVMESDSDLRKLGEKIQDVREAVDGSDLTAVLTAIAAGASGGTVLAVQQAARVLSKAVESILKRNKDDLVATFQGTYGAEGIQADRTDQYDRPGASVTLNLSTPAERDATKSKSR